MVKNDNPAGRLYSILKQASSKDVNLSIKQVWANVLEVNPQGTTIFKAIISLQELVQETKLLIKSSDINHDLYLQSYSNVEQLVIHTNLDSSWGNIKDLVTESVLTRLEFCADSLSKTYKEGAIEDLKELEKLINEFFDYVCQSKIDLSLKTIIFESIENIKEAITYYKIQGVKPLRKALEKSIGSIIVNSDEYDKADKSDESFAGKYREFLDKVDNITSLIKRTRKSIFNLTKETAKFLSFNQEDTDDTKTDN